MPLSPGSRVGVHVVVSLIGKGGMGEVYRARDTTLDRDVAIKRLPDAVANDAERLARFEREAKALAALNHPNVAQIYAVESGSIVMEFIPGETLRGPVPLDRALDYAAQIASALDAAHEKGIVHRDLKPGNVMVTPDGVIKVLDFSLAGRDRAGADRDPEQSPTLTGPMTSAGLIMGTAAYMAPEQASGRPVDKRADIFAFGVVLWEMLTGRRMFDGETVSHVLAAVLTSAPDLAAVPARVRPLLARCLEKDPKKRLRDIGDAMSLVLPIEAEAAGARNAAPRAASLSRRLVSVSGWIAAGALLAAVAWLTWSRPAAIAVADTPVVRFAIPRALDIYNQTARAFAVAPDGLALAYYDAAADGRHAVFVRTLTTGEVRETQGSRTFSPRADSLVWSPDSRQLVRGTFNGSFVVDLASQATRPLCDCRFTGGSWSRDDVILLGAGGPGEGIRRVSPGDRTVQLITKPDASRSEGDRWPVFLPDGRRFLFTRTAPGAGDSTYLGSLDGDEPKRLADGSFRLIVGSPDGGEAFLIGIDTTGAVSQRFHIETLSLTGSPATLLAGAISVSGSKNGVLAGSAAGSRPRLIPTWFDRKGTAVGTVGQPAFFESVALSADGRVLVGAEGNSGELGLNDLWSQDLMTGVRARLTFNADNDSTPVWSPDGRTIAYTSRRGRLNLPYRRSADGTGNETPLFAYDQDAYVNDWSADARWIIYTSRKPGSQTDNDLWALPMTGGSAGAPVLYLDAPGRQQQAQFSPDGRFVAYGSDQSGAFEIYVQPFPDASQGKWMVSSGGGAEPRWSRDGKELFFFSGQTLMAVPVNLASTFSHGAPAPLFEAAIQAGYVNDSHRWQVAADGQRFLLLPSAGQQQAAPLDVIVNWPALLKK